MYFWESNYDRAMQWAKDKQARGKIKESAVIGAVLDLSYCCDLQDDLFIKMVATYHRLMAVEYTALKKPIPVNKDVISDIHKDKLMRFLDCATIEFMHESIRKEALKQFNATGYTNLKIFDSVRGVFPEGGPAYPGAGFSARSHIQICIRNPNCIKGFFLKREEIDFFSSELKIGAVKAAREHCSTMKLSSI
jgi:hypothetical protein